MNKICLFFCLALVAVAHAVPEADDFEDAESQAAALMPSDSEEVAKLPANQQEYADFCISSRDHVRAAIRTSSNRVASQVFNLLFQTAESIGQEAISTVQQANSRLTPSLNDPSTVIEPVNDEVEKIIQEAQEKIKEGEAQPVAFLTGFKATISAVSKKVGAMISNRLDMVAARANLSTVWQGVVEVCQAAKELEKQLKDQYNEVERTVPYSSLECVTTKRLARVEGLCSFSAAVAPTLPKLLNRA